MTDKANSQLAALAGKYLTFELGSEFYGVEILKVQEIIQMMEVTHLPRTPAFVRGVINLRGRIIPVLDLRSKFELPEKEDTERTCIIVVQVSHQDRNLTMGIVVDEVSEVKDITADQIEKAPDFGTRLDTAFILGMGKVEGRVVIMLNIERALTEEDLELMAQAAGSEFIEVDEAGS